MQPVYAAAATRCAHRHKIIGGMLDQLDALVQRSGGPAAAEGPDYSALDAYAFTLCRWTHNFSYPHASARTWARICSACWRGLRWCGCCSWRGWRCPFV